MGSSASREGNSARDFNIRPKGDRSQSVSDTGKRKKKNKRASRLKRHSLQECDLKDVSYDIRGFRKGSATEGAMTSSTPMLGANSAPASDPLSCRFLAGTRIPPADYDSDTTPSRMDSRMDLLRKFNTTVDKLITHWPKYQFFRTVNPSKLGTEMIAKIIELFNHLLDQGDVIQKMAADNQRITQFLRHRDDLLLAKRPSSNDLTLVKTISNSSNCQMPPSPKLSTPPRSSSPSPSPDHDKNAKEQLMSDLRRLRESAAMSQTARRSILIETQNTSPSTNNDGAQWQLEEANKRVEELTEELRRTKNKLDQLEAEKISNKISKMRSSSLADEPKDDVISSHRSRTAEALKELHCQLDKMTLNEAKAELDLIHRLHDDKSKFKLLCAIVVEAYEVCLTNKDDFIVKLKNTIQNPLAASSNQSKATTLKSKRASVQEHISIFETMTSSRSFKDAAAVPESFLNQAIHLASLRSDAVDVTSLVNTVFASLQESHPRMMTQALCESQVIKKYATDSCSLCWQMVLLDPPLQLSFDASSFSDDLHIPFRSHRSKPMLGADIDYHLLPAICDQEEGSILSKGRVAIRIIR